MWHIVQRDQAACKIHEARACTERDIGDGRGALNEIAESSTRKRDDEHDRNYRDQGQDLHRFKDKAETDETFCELLNAKAVENLAVAMKEVDGLLVHVSTDYVFGGDPYNTPCKEDLKGTPTGVYGKTKLQGEKNILASG